ncbi:hypothetical protein PR048_026468 [Dryococelus australis]|uniref:Uncharacterized protein n=1 Tax=Dryococelus australis TaxID=614101 RepID=A0ABQ9GLE4_9NEOP|nr:hypothetical protein PR048_026468 [Dryococelus australis]
MADKKKLSGAQFRKRKAEKEESALKQKGSFMKYLHRQDSDKLHEYSDNHHEDPDKQHEHSDKYSENSDNQHEDSDKHFENSDKHHECVQTNTVKIQTNAMKIQTNPLRIIERNIVLTLHEVVVLSHEETNDHMTNFQEWKDLETRLKRKKAIDEEYLCLLTQEEKFWHKVLERLIALVRVLGAQNLTFRGTQEKLFSYGNGNSPKSVEYLS